MARPGTARVVLLWLCVCTIFVCHALSNNARARHRSLFVWGTDALLADSALRTYFKSLCTSRDITRIYLYVRADRPTYFSDNRNTLLALMSSLSGVSVWASWGDRTMLPDCGTANNQLFYDGLARILAWNAANPSAAFSGVMHDMEAHNNRWSNGPVDGASCSLSWPADASNLMQSLVDSVQAMSNQLSPTGVLGGRGAALLAG